MSCLHPDLNKSGQLWSVHAWNRTVKNNPGLYQTENRKLVSLQQNIYISFSAILEIEVG